MPRPLVIAVVVLGVGGCHSGPSAEHFAPAMGPRGVLVSVDVGRSKVSGELLEVQDSALLVLQLDVTKVMLVPLREIRTAVFHQRGPMVMHGAFIIGGTAAAEARLLSRYPAGLTPTLRTALLAAYGQTEPEVAR